MRHAACLSVLVLASAALAQQRREPVRGSAVLADGSPWAGATVHALTRPLPADERLGTADEQVATSDSKGRFTVNLLPGRHYTAWAIEDLGEARYRASFAAERVLAGRPLELVADEPRARLLLKFAGLDAWRARGEVVAHLISRTGQRIVLGTTLQTDEWLLPPMPGRGAELELLCDGAPLWQWPPSVDLTAAAGEPWVLPSPRAVRIRVVGGDGKTPVGNAALALRTIDPAKGMREIEGPLARTDANGEAVVTLSLPAKRDFDWVNYAFGVHAPGFAPVANIERVRVPLAHDAAGKAAAISLQLPPGVDHALVLTAGERPFVGPVLLGSAGASLGGSFATHGDHQRHEATDRDGRLALQRQFDEPVLVLGMVESLGVVATSPVPLHAVAMFGCVAGNEARAQITWDLARLHALVLTVTDAAGTPIDGASIAVLVDSGRGIKRALSGLATDRSGRAAVLVPPDVPLSVVAWTGDGFAVASDVRPAAGAEPTCLRLQAAPALPGTVVGKDGRPVRFAEVQCYAFAHGAGTQCLAAAIQMFEVPTDRDGAFHLPLFPGLQYSLRGVVLPDDEHYLTRTWTVGVDEPEQLEIDLGKAR
ncbi:MAG TPA: hypothetical protein VFZ65_17185 [Planctomycetota bacterium]|nr:hypothetical protein [Planctomycetota bacterium]